MMRIFENQEKVQTNDDTLEIEAQTDEIEMATRWTQHPADDLKGFGIGSNCFRAINRVC